MQRKYKNSLVIGVTGGIGSGQSTVCSFLERWHCKVINADLKAKQVIKRDKGLQSDLKRTFGNDIFTGNNQLNSKRLAELAFSNEIQTQKLNQLVHPRMVEILVEDMERARFSGKFPLVIIDAALIYEISIEQMFDHVVVINAPLKDRMNRVKKRDGMTQKQFKERAGKQIPLADKVKWADYVIENDADLDSLKSRTHKVYKELTDLQRKTDKNKAGIR